VRRVLLVVAIAALGGCYDLAALEQGEAGVRLVARAMQARSSMRSFELELADSAIGDLQLAAFLVSTTTPLNDPPVLGEGWMLLRVASPCAASDALLYTRSVRGPEDATLRFTFDESFERVGAATAAVRGIDPLLPHGPVDSDIGILGDSLSIRVTPALREDQRWIGFGYAGIYNGSYTLPGMPEYASNGRMSLLFGAPEVTATNAAPYMVSGSGADCSYLALVALLPRP
jgi:hypothetical protein